MDMQSGASEHGVNIVNGHLLLAVDNTLEAKNLNTFCKHLLAQIEATHVKGVILNVSAIETLDSSGFVILKNLSKAVAMMGACMVFVGFQPGVASFLIDIDMDVSEILTAITIEDALEIMQEMKAVRQEVSENPLETVYSQLQDEWIADDAV